MVKLFKMDKERIIEISKDVKNIPNKELVDASNGLFNEFEKTKELIIDLTRHLESVEELYNKILEELNKRKI